MSSFDWQTVAAIALICWAIYYIARAAIRVLGKQQATPACSGCGSCASNSTTNSAAPPNFVGIESLRRLN